MIVQRGKNGGRIIPLNSRLKNSLIDLLGDYQKRGKWMISLMDDFVINTQRNRTGGTSPQVITNFFHNLYRNMGLFWIRFPFWKKNLYHKNFEKD
jgi:hypothetical protein